MSYPESTRKITKEVMLAEPHVLWEIGKVAEVEYFPDEFDKLVLESIDHPGFEKALEWLDDGTDRIAIDLEWKPNFDKTRGEYPASVFQMATPHKIVVLRHPADLPGNEILKKFLMTHKFIAKGCKTDRTKMQQKFGPDFSIDLLDFERLYLIPNGFSSNFDAMVVEFYKNSSIEFKDKNVTCSNWQADVLTTQQVLYAGFDATALMKSYINAVKRYPNAIEDFLNRSKTKADNQSKEAKNLRNKKHKSELYEHFRGYLNEMMPLNAGKAYWLSRNFWPLFNKKEKEHPENILPNSAEFGLTTMRGPVFELLCQIKGVDMSSMDFAQKLKFWDQNASKRELMMSQMLDTYRVLGVGPYEAMQGVQDTLEIMKENKIPLPFDLV
ncbi:3'-5' exonuclease family protein [Trichomonas vaginalis G3]|uniref:3'-5' exonuclease family protein n=1 Tax=Trichomonas vaginalis (strain ATCC PRA-98 / G3) TaxID=412133 RepID=A2FSN1_TRIV3|nr:exonuclease 3'-5' family [Trichomonas vaginalis G3]EAX92087.1 3'-5' exonuclease family protein [Trichomonas vaginalis G3]KAI5550592.1 exonuclease 3'-5' family [Trichomonas vaginalis G3]|eukprot:XP_001305017.1 3'-5' exonuclease family protein [Trichomonas vaginalis G3]